ncbi:MAG: hypothetical protein QGF94_04595 [Candidatus Thalassarchaeaceae archaeon]|jgi:hypothetical protein|nr:hypothetical protein [Candidatus Thalassarchaeaceae archaeon]
MATQSTLEDWVKTQDECPTLEDMALEVISVMHTIPELVDLPIAALQQIPLGKVRKNATNLHAVCRYKKGVQKANGVGPEDVRCVDVHPEALTSKWMRYAAFLLFHEYLHALGFANHDRTFRQMEALWPDQDAKTMGKDFGTFLRMRTAKWLLECPKCNISHPRKRRGNGRYRCRTCRVILVDIPVNSTQPNP